MNNQNRYVKTPQEIKIMREGGKIHANILKELEKMIAPGIDTWDLEKKFLKLCKKYELEPACKGYETFGLPPFPTGLCVSVNNQSVHCFPKKGNILNEGDVITVDTSTKYKGLHLDAAFATGVGKISKSDENLLKTSKETRDRAIKKVKPGVRIGVISNTMGKTAYKGGCNVLKDYAGHGIGEEMHEWPEIPCDGNKFEGPKLKEGMTICIESLVCQGDDRVCNTSEWETKMCDGKKFAQFEHTILVTEDGYEILTQS